MHTFTVIEVVEGRAERHLVVQGVTFCRRAVEKVGVALGRALRTFEATGFRGGGELLIAEGHLVSVLHDDVVAVVGFGHLVEYLIVVAIHGRLDGGYRGAVALGSLFPGRHQVSERFRVLADRPVQKPLVVLAEVGGRAGIAVDSSSTGPSGAPIYSTGT